MVAKRKKIGIYYRRLSVFPAIKIYILNLIQGLNTLDEIKKPELTILYDDAADLDYINSLNYPYISLYKLKSVQDDIGKRLINKISRILFNKNQFNSIFDKNFPKDLDAIFPYNESEENRYVKQKMFWKPDFQEFYYPIYFTIEEINFNINFLSAVSASSDAKLVLSSNDSLRDFKEFFPGHVCQTVVYPFVSFLDDINGFDAEAVLKRYSISRPYFFVANQFWPHKNHIILFKAVEQLKKEGHNPLIVCSGKTSSMRDDSFFDRLTYYLKFHKLEENFVFTGFIDRKDQLVLMKNAIAVIQPSLFEGWSTVIEDAKALSQFVIASDLKVNQEQIQEGVLFFNPYDHKQLSLYMKAGLEDNLQKVSHYYNERVERNKKVLEEMFGL